MKTAFHPMATQFCEVNLLNNVPQNPQMFLKIETPGIFHLG